MSHSIGMIELTSIAGGIFAADKMAKASDVEINTAASVCPGKYIIIIHGSVAAVESAMKAGEEHAEEYIVDSIVIPNVTSSIFPAIVGATVVDSVDAFGIIESFSLATIIMAADSALKAADIQPIEIRMGNGIGGKAYFTFAGGVAAVQAGIEAGTRVAVEKGLLVNTAVIPSLSEKLVPMIL